MQPIDWESAYFNDICPYSVLYYLGRRSPHFDDLRSVTEGPLIMSVFLYVGKKTGIAIIVIKGK